MTTRTEQSNQENLVQVTAGTAILEGNLDIPDGAEGIVMFAHGSGSSRFSSRNQFVAEVLREGGLATLLFDLLTSDEEAVDQYSREYRFNIDLLTDRLVGATEWLLQYPVARHMKVGYFGASTGAAAALNAAAKLYDAVQAVVSRGGRPDLAASLLPEVKAPTLLIVGGADTAVIGMNEQAMELLKAEKELQIVPGATHLFEEPGTLEEVARLAREWFQGHLTSSRIEGAKPAGSVSP